MTNIFKGIIANIDSGFNIDNIMFRFYPFIKRVSNGDSVEEIIGDFWKNGFINGFICGTFTTTILFITGNTVIKIRDKHSKQ